MKGSLNSPRTPQTWHKTWKRFRSHGVLHAPRLFLFHGSHARCVSPR